MEFRGAKPPNMQNKKLIRFVQSVILLPALTISMPFGNLPREARIVATDQTVFEQKVNTTLKMQAQAIDAYFSAHDMPILGTGLKMAIEADKNSLDWRLLPAIAVRESTGGKNDCTKAENNFFGWGSCKISFNSTNEAIEIIAMNLGGNNPNTAFHYADKTVKQILRAYNPPSIVPHYAQQVLSIMNAIGAADLGVSTATS